MPERLPQKSIIIHGGAGEVNLSDERDKEILDSKQRSLTGILAKRWAQLTSDHPQHGHALHVAVATIMDMEAHAAFNAGYGSAVGYGSMGEPHVAMDAMIAVSDEDSLYIGGVIGVSNTRHPILVAEKVLYMDRTNVLQGNAANNLVTRWDSGLEVIANSYLMTDYKRDKFFEFRRSSEEKPQEGGTVGVVVFDGINVVAATSTGGRTGHEYGRVGDSAIFGAGTFTTTVAGASATGWEKLMGHLTTSRAVGFINEQIDPQKAAELALAELQETPYHGRGGIIIADRNGKVAAAHNTNFMPHAYRTSGMREGIVLPRVV